ALTPPAGSGIGTWQSPLTIRETIIVLMAVGALMFQWAQINSQLGQVSHDVAQLSASLASIHPDVATTAAGVRTHVETPGHSVSMERIAVLQNRLDEVSAQVKQLQIQTYSNGATGGGRR